MDENSRRRKRIIDFIIEHLGCTVADIERGLHGDPTRTVIFRHIGELKKEGVISNESGRKNRNTLIPNQDNEIWFTEERLLDFKKKYFNLLEKSLSHPQTSNVVNEMKSQSGKETYIHKIGGMLGKLYSEFKNANELYSRIGSIVKETERTFSDLTTINIKIPEFDYNRLLEGRGSTPYETLKERIANPKSPDQIFVDKIKDDRISKSDMEKIKRLAEITILNINSINQLQKQYSIHVENSAYLVLTSWLVVLFLFLVYVINLRSITVWPEKIADKQKLFEMNEFVHNNIEEIKIQLIHFLSESKDDRVRSEMDSILSQINPLNKEKYFIKMFYDYSILDMKEEIIDILDSLNKMERKDIQYDEKDYLNKIHDSSKMLLDSML